MSDRSIADRVGIVLISQLCLESAPALTDLLGDDLNADSLDVIELALAFEDEFQIEIADKDAYGFKTVGDVVDYMNSQAVT